jgi:hypothetical protein
VLDDKETLFPAATFELPSAIVHTNEADFDPNWAAYLLAHPYKARTVKSDAIVLGRLPHNTMLLGDQHFILQLEGRVAFESLPHAMRGDEALLASMVDQPQQMTVFDEDCVLLTRYGYGTWGHWLAEIVPTAAIVERRYPGRFRYAVPSHGSREYATAMRQSLHAYGIDPDRLIQMPPDKAYLVSSARVVTPVWTDHAPHPAALDVMRGAITLSAYEARPERVALIRRGSQTRAIANYEDIEQYLRNEGFTIIDIASLSFPDQVRTFQSASTIFSVIGSELTGLIYSPGNVRVLAVGPATWGDRFFYALAQHRGARWAEARGPSQWNGGGMLRDAAFELPLQSIRNALTKLELETHRSSLSGFSISYY